MRGSRDHSADVDEATTPSEQCEVVTDPAVEAGGEPRAVQVGDRVGRHLLTAELGQGGMGRVFAAHDGGLDRLVAIKFVAVVNAAMVDRFLAEARVTARCIHPNIVGVYEIGRHHDAPYLVLEHLAGPSLAKLMRGERLPVARVVAIMTAVARALACAHSHGIVHRDLTPANIVVLPDDTVKVLDFGIAGYAQAGGPSARGSGEIAGTVPYMAPEQLADGEVDGRADLWAFGVVLHQLLTGVRPFDPLSGPALRAELADTERPTPSIVRHRADLPPALVAVVARCLEKARARRWRSADELVAALQGIADDDPSRPRAATARPARPRRIARTAALIALVAIALGVVGLRRRATTPGIAAAAATLAAGNDQLRRLESAADRLRAAGDAAAADALFDRFVAQPENAALRAEAWLRRSDRERAHRALEPALASAAAAYLAAGDPGTATRALTAIVAIQLAGRRWPEVERALAVLGPSRDPAIGRAADALAVATRRSIPAGAAVGPTLAAAARLLTGRPLTGVPRAVQAIDLDGDGRDEVVGREGDTLRAWRPGQDPLWQVPWPGRNDASCAGRDATSAWFAVPQSDATRLYRVDATGATAVLTAGPGSMCALGDLDGDGAVELYVGTLRAVVRYRPEPDGTWPARRVEFGSLVNALTRADLDGDGRAELAVAVGEWMAYDVRVLAGPALTLVDRLRLGRVSALVALARGPGAPPVLLARKDANWPSVRYLPTDRPGGAPDGFYALELAHGRLRVIAHRDDDLAALGGSLVAADIDGDGRDEGLATERWRSIRVLRLDDRAGLESATIDGAIVLAAGHFGEGPAATVLARVVDGPRSSAWWLGEGATALPPIVPAAGAADAPTPDGLDAPLATVWRRATELGQMGATAAALAAFEQLAALVPPELQPGVLAEVLALRRRAGEPFGAILAALAARAAPGSEAELAALTAAVTAAVDDGELVAAVRSLDAALGSPALGPEQRRQLLATRDRVAPVEVTLFDGGSLDAAWQILDPIGVRRDPVTHTLELDSVGEGPLVAVELDRTRGPVGLTIDGTITRAEWSAGLGFALRPVGAGLPFEELTVGNVGGGGIYDLVAQRADPDAVTDPLRPYPDITASVPFRFQVLWFPDDGRAVWDLAVDGTRVHRTVRQRNAAAARWRFELRAHNRAAADAPARIVVRIARVTAAGLAVAPPVPPSASAAARLALANGDLERARALLARGAGAEAALAAAMCALRAGDRTTAARWLARWRGTGPLSGPALATLAHLARVDDGAYAEVVRAVAGRDQVAVIAAAWITVARQHPEAELVQRELTQNLRAFDLDEPGPAAASLLFLRARAHARIGEDAAAAADLDALLAPDRVGAVPSDLRGEVYLERARLARRRGADDEARAALRAALDGSPWPESVADAVLLDPVLAELAAGPGLERILALGRPLTLP